LSSAGHGAEIHRPAEQWENEATTCGNRWQGGRPGLVGIRRSIVSRKIAGLGYAPQGVPFWCIWPSGLSCNKYSCLLDLNSQLD
jgi:hypothetical protein